MERITLDMLKDELVSVLIKNGRPQFYTGFDIHISRHYSPPTKTEGIKICQYHIAYWQRVLEYYELCDRKEDPM